MLWLSPPQARFPRDDVAEDIACGGLDDDESETATALLVKLDALLEEWSEA